MWNNNSTLWPSAEKAPARGLLCRVFFSLPDQTAPAKRFAWRRAVNEIMCKYIVDPGRPQMTIRCMHITCWITKATDTHSEYVILIAFHGNCGYTWIDNKVRELANVCLPWQHWTKALVWFDDDISAFHSCDGSLFLSSINYCLRVFWCPSARISELELEQRTNINFLVRRRFNVTLYMYCLSYLSSEVAFVYWNF